MLHNKGSYLPEGTKIKLIDSGKGSNGIDGCSGILGYGSHKEPIIVTVTSKKACSGLLDSDSGFNVEEEYGEIWRIHLNATYEFVELPEKHWVINPGFDSENDRKTREFAYAINRHFDDCRIGGSDKYYFFDGNEYHDSEKEEPETEYPIFTFEEWKTLASFKKEPEKVVFKEGDYVYIVSNPAKYESIIEGDVVKVCTVLGYGAKLQANCNQQELFFIFDCIRPATPEEISLAQGKQQTTPVEDQWKVGDVLPEKWLNSFTTFYTGPKKESYDTLVDFYGDREVESVDENGYAYISGTIHVYLGPKKNYPTYNQSNNFSPINQQSKTQTNEKQNISSGSTVSSITECIISSSKQQKGSSAYLPGDQERITQGSRREGTAVRG